MACCLNTATRHNYINSTFVSVKLKFISLSAQTQFMSLYLTQTIDSYQFKLINS